MYLQQMGPWCMSLCAFHRGSRAWVPSWTMCCFCCRHIRQAIPFCQNILISITPSGLQTTLFYPTRRLVVEGETVWNRASSFKPHWWFDPKCLHQGWNHQANHIFQFTMYTPMVQGTCQLHLVLAWLSAHPVTTPIPCAATLAEAPTLAIPACPKDWAFSLTALTSLGNINKHLLSSLFCFLPTSHTFPGPTQAIDAIVINNNNLITVQVCTSSEVYADLETFQTIWQNLPHTIRQTHKWCHIFVTSMHRTAKQLQNQSMMNQVMNPLGVDIFYYSTVFDVDLFKEQLDLICQRLDEVVSRQ